MSTYLIDQPIQFTRQAGDIADVVVTVPDVISLTGKTIKFTVIRTSDGTTVFSKITTDMTVVDQVVTIPILTADTTGKAGSHIWEMVILATGFRVTVGQGTFVITKTYTP